MLSAYIVEGVFIEKSSIFIMELQTGSLAEGFMLAEPSTSLYKKESWTIASAKALRDFLGALVFYEDIIDVTRYFEKYFGKFYIK